ncbi:hypothetical protein CQ010_01375 [Arthrobacter sp. MYb211]|nr:hypothetical protein CQ015_03630 [Arthrobacter sp. MYb221]PRC10522.1 hypothetical protein CQ010_01375 [Arthrobacter sp. MYb211]
MPGRAEYIEYEADGQWWIDIYIPQLEKVCTYGPFAQRLDRCPRCQARGYVITDGTGQCPTCKHQWEATTHPTPPGQVGHISMNIDPTGQTNEHE